MREDLGEALAGMALGDQRGELDRRMARGKPDQVGAGITGRAEHGGSDWFLGVRHWSTQQSRAGEAGLKEIQGLGKAGRKPGRYG